MMQLKILSTAELGQIVGFTLTTILARKHQAIVIKTKLSNYINYINYYINYYIIISKIIQHLNIIKTE